MMQPRFAAVQAHIAITMLAVVALFALLDGRPVWPALFSFVPWFGLGLAVLEVVLLVRILLPSAIYASVAPVLSRVVMVAHVLVFALAGLGALVQLNARLDRSQPREYSTRVTALFGEDADLLETVWYSWARVDSWRRQNASERILLTGRERRALWGGQPILVRVGDGRFFIPWVIALEEDKETKAATCCAPSPTRSSRGAISSSSMPSVSVGTPRRPRSSTLGVATPASLSSRRTPRHGCRMPGVTSKSSSFSSRSRRGLSRPEC